MPKPLPCAPSLRPFGEVILSGVATGPDTALQPRHGLLTPAMNINTYKKSIFPLKKRIELTPYLITPLCLSAVKRAAPPCFWLLVFLFFAPNFVLSSPPPRALFPCSPGEEQVGFVLEVEIEVGDVVLLGALLLLAVAETPAEHRVSTSRGVIFFLGGGCRKRMGKGSTSALWPRLKEKQSYSLL